jgi:hypothetical protein
MPPIRDTLNERELKKLIEMYKRAERQILATVADATDYGKARGAEQLLQIDKILTELGKDTGEWLDQNIPAQYERGTTDMLKTMQALKVGIKETSTMSVIDRRAVEALISETQAAFAASLTTVSRNAQKVISTAIKQAISDSLAQGRILGETRKQISDRIKANIKADGISALTDKGGRDWTLDRYAEMLARTKMVEARNTGLANKMIANGYDLVEITRFGSAHLECGRYEGKILSLTGKTPGYTTLSTAISNGLFHPNCKHQMNAIRTRYQDILTAYDPTSGSYKQAFAKNAPIPPKGKIKAPAPAKPSKPLYAGVAPGKPMAPKDAIKDVNPNFKLGGVWRINCQKTVPTYELRRRGYDLTALPNDQHSRIMGTYLGIAKMWKSPDHDFKSYIKEITRYDGSTYLAQVRTVKSHVTKHLKSYPVGARVQVSYAYTRYRSAHTIVMERVPVSKEYPTGMMFIDPQVGTIENSLNMTGKTKFAIIRMDDKEIDETMVDYIAKPNKGGKS